MNAIVRYIYVCSLLAVIHSLKSAKVWTMMAASSSCGFTELLCNTACNLLRASAGVAFVKLITNESELSGLSIWRFCRNRCASDVMSFEKKSVEIDQCNEYSRPDIGKTSTYLNRLNSMYAIPWFSFHIFEQIC